MTGVERLPGQLLAVAGWVGFAAVQQTAAAAEGGEAHATVPQVVITGSRLPALDGESISPTQVITREALRQRGVSTLRQLLEDEPGSGGLDDRNGMATFAPGASAWALRGLGAQGTLVLLNGRRVAPYGLANFTEVFVNIDALPFEAIDRIEIVKTGAAAIYGSDAVAGTVNIITRKDWTGLSARISQAQSLKSSRFGETSLALAGGWAVDTARPTHITANLELWQRDQVMWSDVLDDTRARYAPLSPAFAVRSTYGWPGNLVGVGSVGTDCPPQLVVGPYCYFDRTATTQAVPSSQRVNLLVNGETQLNATLSGYAELLWGQTETRYVAPGQPYGSLLSPLQWGDPSTGESRTFWYRGLPAGHPLNALGIDDAQLRYRFADVPQQTDVRANQWRALMGLKGQHRRFDWDAAIGHSGSAVRADYRGWWSYSGFHQVIGNDDPSQVDPDFFNRGYQIGQANSEQVLNTLFPTYGYRGDARNLFADAKMAGPLLDMAAGPVQSAFGVDLRRERFTVAPDARLSHGDIVANGVSASNATRNVVGLFGELGVPLAPAVLAQLAARLDKYQGTETHASPKVGLRWQAAPTLTFRGTAEAGFRAPNLTESADSTKYSYYHGVADPQRCTQAVALATDLQQSAAALPATDLQRAELLGRASAALQNECAGSVANVLHNNPTLKPETSLAFSWGLVLAPSRSWRFAVDTWSIQRRNEIAFRSLSELLDSESVQPSGTINRDALTSDRTFTAAEQAQYGVTSGALRSAVVQFENIARTRTRGTDVAAQTGWTTPWGRLSWTLDASYLHDIRSWSTDRNGWGDNLAGRLGYPRWQAANSWQFATATFTHQLRAVTRSGTSLQGDYYDTTYSPAGCEAMGFDASQCRVGGYTRWDYAATYRGLRDVTLGLHIRNLFERQVPVDIPHWRNIASVVPPTDEDARGRMLRLTLEWRPR